MGFQKFEGAERQLCLVQALDPVKADEFREQRQKAGIIRQLRAEQPRKILTMKLKIAGVVEVAQAPASSSSSASTIVVLMWCRR